MNPYLTLYGWCVLVYGIVWALALLILIDERAPKYRDTARIAAIATAFLAVGGTLIIAGTTP